MFWRCESVKFTAVEVIRVMMNCRLCCLEKPASPSSGAAETESTPRVRVEQDPDECLQKYILLVSFFPILSFPYYHTVLIIIRHFLHANIDLFVKANEIKIAIQLLFCVNFLLKEVSGSGKVQNNCNLHKRKAMLLKGNKCVKLQS